MTEEAPRQSWQADRYATNSRFVADLGAPVIELLAPRPGEQILDLGCGDGALTAQLGALGRTVIGVDAGSDMVEAARRRGLDAYLMDGQDLRFAAEFDAVLSNAALHWMRDADAVLRGVRRALKPGGRFVGEFGGRGNVAAITVALVAVLTRRGDRWPGRDPLVFPERRGLCGQTRGPCLRGRSGRPDCAANAAADRHGGLARNVRGEFLGPARSADTIRPKLRGCPA